MVLTFSIKAGHLDNEMLHRILKRGRYATLDLEAGQGPDRPEELVIIQRIRAGMIASQEYPLSPRMQIRGHRADLASWENEGGSISSSFKRRSTC